MIGTHPTEVEARHALSQGSYSNMEEKSLVLYSYIHTVQNLVKIDKNKCSKTNSLMKIALGKCSLLFAVFYNTINKNGSIWVSLNFSCMDP